MNRLPLELVNRILEYDGRIKYRYGKYMNQIAPDDDRYKLLLTVPQIQPCPNYIQYGYMKISDSRNKIYCEKMKPSLTASYCYGEKTHLIVTKSYTDKVSYILISQGFQYSFVIYKPPKPTFIESVLQNWYDLCCKFIYN